MAPTLQDKIAELARTVREIGPRELRRQAEAFQLFDVREEAELLGGTIPGAVHLSRGLLELEIEYRCKDRAAAIVLYCAGRNAIALSGA